MELYDDNLQHKREEELKDDQYYDKEFIIDILKQIFSGLKYLHRKNIAHRDIDPKNIMIKDGFIKIVDFGFSSHLRSDSEMANSMAGKRNYAAPEVLAGKDYNP